VYPRPEYEGKPWSDWGQGILLPDGRYLSAIGDHLGQDGNSYLYVYDPDAGQLTRFSDVQSLVGHEAGSWGYGKIHAQMVQPTCDSVIFGTYWGNRRDIDYSGSYSGDYLFQLDPSTLEIEPLGVPLEEHGIPSLATADGLIYGEAAVPIEEAPPERGSFFVYDPESREVVYQSDDPTHTGFRSILVAPDGSAFVAADDSKVLRYEPGGELTEYEQPLPAGWLRAATAPAEDGSVYGVSTQPDRFFALRPDGSFEDLGPAQAYTASIALLPDGRIVYVPEAHGDSWMKGTPVVAFDPETGTEETLVTLNETAERELGLTLGGSYSVVVDAERGFLFVGFNAGVEQEDPWGEVVLAVIHL
jgi:DNA-binding beta-propeller fold protein YncE